MDSIYSVNPNSRNIVAITVIEGMVKGAVFLRNCTWHSKAISSVTDKGLVTATETICRIPLKSLEAAKHRPDIYLARKFSRIDMVMPPDMVNMSTTGGLESIEEFMGDISSAIDEGITDVDFNSSFEFGTLYSTMTVKSQSVNYGACFPHIKLELV